MPEVEAPIVESALTESQQTELNAALDAALEQPVEPLQETEAAPIAPVAAETTEATEAPVEQPAAETQSWLTPDLSELAETFGITSEEAESFGSVKALTTAIKLAQRAGKPVEKAPEPAPNIEDTFEPLSEDEYDPKLAKTVNSLAAELKKLRGENESLKQNINPLQDAAKTLQEQQIAQETKWVDSQFATHGKELKSLLGEGDFATVAANKTAMSNRKRVLDTLVVLQGMNPSADREKLFEKAIRIEFADELEKAKKQSNVQKIQAQASRKIGSPQRVTSPVVNTRKVFQDTQDAVSDPDFQREFQAALASHN